MHISEIINGGTVSIILFMIGLYGLMVRRNIIKSVISIGILQSALILFFLNINYDQGKITPIGEGGSHLMVDPLPQALMITVIVIGVAITAVSLTMLMTLYHRYGTSNWSKAFDKRKEEV